MAVTNADILGWLNANPGADAALINQTMAEAGVSAAQYQSATGAPPPPVESASVVDLYQQVLGRPPESQAVVDEWTRQFGSTIDPTEVAQFEQAAQLEKTNPVAANIKGQILSQGTTDKWTGEGKGSAEANAADMANILAGIGITDISQFGQLPDGSFGNKLTGQPVPNTYSERQTGNAFGGTFAGKGNTGYRVEFDASGKPLFYTTGASSSDVPSWVVPALAIGGAIYGLGGLEGLFGGVPSAAGAAGITAAEAAGLGLTASEAAALGLSASEFAAAGGLGAGFSAAGLPSGVGTFFGEGVASGIPAWDTAFTGAGGLFNSAFGLPAGNGAFIGEGVPSGVPAWDTAYTTAGGVFDPAFALGPDGLVGNPLPPITPPVIPPVIPSTSTPPTNFLDNLTPGQIANIISGVGGLVGGAGIARAVTPKTTPMGVSIPTQGVPLNTADYYNAIQQNYNRLLPAVPRDVATPLAQWYNSTYGA